MHKLSVKSVFKLGLGLALGLTVSGTSFGADSSSGCGMGWQLLPDQSLVSSFTRSMVNATFSNSIAMTMGTSGCARHSIVYDEKKGIHFVEANKELLLVEMAVGQGEYLTAMAEVFHCQDSQNFAKILKANYGSINNGAELSGEELYNNIKSVSAKNNLCAMGTI